MLPTVRWRCSRTTEVWDDRLVGPDDLRAWGVHAGLLSDRDPSGRERARDGDLFERALLLREAIHDTFAALAAGEPPSTGPLEALSREWAEARGRMTLGVARDGEVRVGFEEGAGLERLIWALAASAGDLLLEADPARIKTCAGPRCGYLYVDSSRNRSRRWCDMAECGNRAKVRRFRSRED
jgi:predicted RNA-binding Zn ribbon-like protein